MTLIQADTSRELDLDRDRKPTVVRYFFCLILLVACQLGCVPQPENSVVVYSAADREYAQPILDGFARHHDRIEVLAQFDIESTKTVGLATRIKSESERPRCDVFWNNELMHTLQLEKQGLLQSIAWDIPSAWPKEMRSPNGNWVGIAARARILIVNRDLLPSSDDRPSSVMDLAAPQWQGKCGVAYPLFGTTSTHFTVLARLLGEEQAANFFKAVQSNAVVLSGNKQVAQQVASGQLAWGLTDTDDALIEIDSGLPVEIIFPDQAPDQLGTLRIPNAVAVIRDCPHPVAAVELANYLVSETTEGRLAMGVSGQFPIRPEHPQASRALKSAEGQRLQVRWMNANFSEAADMWATTSEQLRQIFKR